MALTMPMILAAVTASASAQDANTEEDDIDDFEEIVVTGIRGALKSARDLKRDADTAIDSITASDVGALPDLSVAEALGRVPGVTVQRVDLSANGGDFPSPEGGGNLIRGLTLVRSELNYRDAFSANGGRALDFGTIPPELIGSVEVFKNSSADLIQGGIGGTINLRTLEPFDRDGAFAVVTLDGTYTDMRDEWAPDFSITAGNRWDASGGEFGLLASYSNSELKSDLNGFQIGQLYPMAVDPSADPLDPTVERIAIPGGWQLRTNEVDRQRESFYGAAQWRNEEGNFEVIAKYARIENDIQGSERTLESFGSCENWQIQRPLDESAYTSTSDFSSPGLPICNGVDNFTGNPLYGEITLPVNGLFESGVITNPLRAWTGASGAEAQLLGIRQVETAMTDDLSINIKWQPTERLFVNLDAHQTTANYTKERLWAGTRFFTNYEVNADLDNPSVRLIPTTDSNPWRLTSNVNCGPGWTGNTDCGNFAPSTPDLSDPDNTFLIYAADEFADNSGDLVAFKADIEYEFGEDGWFDSVKFGGRFSRREQLNQSAGLNWAQLAPPWTGANQYVSLSALQNGVSETLDYDDFFRGGVVEGGQIAYLATEILNDYDRFATEIAADPAIPGGGWMPLRTDGVVDYEGQGTIGDVVEKTTDFYARLDFGNEFDNGMALDGNIGLRYTKSTVTGDGALEYVQAFGDDIAPFFPETAALFSGGSIDRSGTFSSVDYWLPSLNTRLELDDESLIRFAVSKAITRPNISQLYSSGAAVPRFSFITEDGGGPPIDVIPTQIDIWGGNPDLQAIESWNYDLSYEYYFGEQDSFTVSLFKKDITNNIVWTSTTVEVLRLDGVDVPVIFNGDVNQDDGDIKGFEVAYQQFYDFLPGIWGNLGLQANYTYIDSRGTAPTPVDDTQSIVDGEQLNPDAGDSFARVYRYGVDDFLGLSKHTANLIGIYQDDKLEVRLAYNWRSEHLSSYRDFITGNPIYQSARGYLDASIKYNFTEDLQFRVQIANITNTVAKAEQQIDATGQRFGRTAFMGDRRIKAGFRYNF